MRIRGGMSVREGVSEDVSGVSVSEGVNEHVREHVSE